MPRRKNLRVKVNARIASKVREKDLIDKANTLMDNPELILPKCSEECVPCPFKKTRARLERIQKYKDDPAKLEKFSKHGDRLARAYAATIGLAHEEKAPYLASAKYPGGTVMFALRGKTNKEKLIGVQHFDSPKWRVLSVLDLVKKRGLHFYSYGDEFVCTGRKSVPPERYMEKAAESAGARNKGEGTYSCPHISPDSERMVFKFTDTDTSVIICPQCGAKNKNTLKRLAEGMAVPSILQEFEISLVRPLDTVSGSADLGEALTMPIDAQLLTDYSQGEMTDRELIERHFEDVRRAIEGRSERLYIRGNKSFGDDLDAFVGDITGDEVEAKALRSLLDEVDKPVVADPKDTVNSLMSRYWTEHGLVALEGVVSAETAKSYFKVDEDSVQSPMKLVRRAVKRAAHEEVSSRMPSYSGLSQHAEFVDQIVRAYKMKGAGGANAVLDGDKSNDHRMRSIAHAFYTSLGISAKSWRFAKEELDFGEHLSPYAKKLLESDGSEDHHEAFVGFMREAGSTEEITRSE